MCLTAALAACTPASGLATATGIPVLLTPLPSKPALESAPATENVYTAPPPVSTAADPGAAPALLFQPAPISVQLNTSLRAVPAYLDPRVQPVEVIAQYEAALQDSGSHMIWYAGTLDGKFSLNLLVSMLPGQADRLLLDASLPVEIRQMENAPDLMHMIFMQDGGGGGLSLEFNPFTIIPGPITLQAAESGVVVLGDHGVDQVRFVIQAACGYPGIFALEFRFGYQPGGGTAAGFQPLPFLIMAACPQKAVLWLYDRTQQSIEEVGSIIFQNDRYVSGQ